MPALRTYDGSKRKTSSGSTLPLTSNSPALQAGELIRWTRNDVLSARDGKTIDLSNGHEAMVVAIDPKWQVAPIGLHDKRTIEVDLRRLRHWDHGYVMS